MQPSIISMNGKIVPLEQAKVTVFDRSFLFGDSLYEVIRTYQGKPFRLGDHLDRLEASAKLCAMSLHQSRDIYAAAVMDVIRAFRSLPGEGNAEVYVRLIVSRGSGKMGFGLKNLETKTQYTLIALRAADLAPPPFEAGTRIQVSPIRRNAPEALNPAAKTGNYLNSLLAYLGAAKAGLDDAILLNADGHVTEGTTFNVFYVNRGIVATPPLDIGILEGITRKVIFEICDELKIPYREVRFPPEYMYSADEVFITGSVKEILPVTYLGNKKIAQGKPGKITKKIHARFLEKVRQEVTFERSKR
jgi:branched-chain amino acid aminotransferase